MLAIVLPDREAIPAIIISHKKPQTFLSDTHPHLRDEFIRAFRNIRFDYIKTGSKMQCLWRCKNFNCAEKCPHIFKATPRGRTKTRPINCLYCSGKKICPCNSLGGKYPHLIPEYCETNVKSIFELTTKSHYIATWKCSHAKCDHHIWKTRVLERTAGRDCPFCAGYQVCECYNLATEFPEVAKQFDLVKNYPKKPTDFPPYSHKKVYWTCTAHEPTFSWMATISNRACKSNCPKCKRSKMEIQMESILETFKKENVILHFECDKRLLTSRLRLDFCVYMSDSLYFGIEMDGIHHFQPIAFGSDTDNLAVVFDGIQERDRRKEKICKENNIPLLRISYRVNNNKYIEIVRQFIRRVLDEPIKSFLEVHHLHP